MTQNTNILLVRTDIYPGMDHIALRDYILESIGLGVLILGLDDTYEIVELPPLSGVAAQPLEPPAAAAKPAPKAANTSEGEEKRAILQRLKDYRASSGLGSLEAVSAKTAHQKARRISAETLRYLCADRAPKMPMSDWRKIGKALDLLEQDNKGKEEDHVSEDHPV